MPKVRMRKVPKNDLGVGDEDSKIRLWLVAVVAVFMLGGGWLIASHSLPYALAKSHTEIALWLNSEHPAPLMHKSLSLRATMLASGRHSKATEPTSQDDGEVAQSSTSKETNKGNEQQGLRAQISALAQQILTSEPLNARAYQLLGEVKQDPEEVRDDMRAAVARSRRSSTAAYWLLNDSVVRGDIRSALDYADILLRTRPALTRYVVAFVGHIAESGPEGLTAVVERLRRQPPWRETVMRALPSSVRDLKTPGMILLALKNSDSVIEISDYRAYLNYLVAKQLVPFAYSTWLQLQTREQLAQIGLLNNGTFERQSTDLPFDWTIKKSQNALSSIEASPSRPNDQALRLVFGSGSVRYGGVSQYVVLAPGRYVLSGETIGELEAKRGLQWQVACAAGSQIGASEIFKGQIPGWIDWSINFLVPDDQKCRGQIVKLLHTARSTSERFISGEVWFDKMSIRRSTD